MKCNFSLQYLNKLNKKVFVMDPLGQDEEKESGVSAERFR